MFKISKNDFKISKNEIRITENYLSKSYNTHFDKTNFKLIMMKDIKNISAIIIRKYCLITKKQFKRVIGCDRPVKIKYNYFGPRIFVAASRNVVKA